MTIVILTGSICFFSPMLSAPTARMAWPTPYRIPMYRIVRYLPEIVQFCHNLLQVDAMLKQIACT